MSSITKTPKKELDVSGKGTPRVVSRMQTRLRTPSKTPDDKKLERERRKAENESLKKKPASGRKLKTAKEKEPANELEEKHSEDEKHVKWEDQENHSSKEESESGEDSEGAVVLDDEKVEDVQVDLPEPLAEFKQPPIIEEPANKPIDVKEEEELERKSTGKSEKVADQHIEKPIVKVSVYEPVDDKEAEAKERERVIVERYNHQWALENQRRQRITEQEHLRRQRVTKKIDAEFERGMAQEYSSRENKSHRASKGNTTLLPTSHSTIKAESVDSDDELVDLTDYKAKLNELRSELEKVSKQLKEKSDLVQSLEANKDKDKVEGGEHLAQVLVHLEASSAEDQKVYQAEISKLKSHIAQLEDTLKSGEQHDVAFIEKLASELEESNRNALEKAKLVDYAHETLDAEIKNMEQQKVHYEADKKRWHTENQEIALRLQQVQAELQRKEVNFKKEVKEGVRTEIQRLKNERKKRQDTTQPPNAPNLLFSQFHGDPVSTLGSQFNTGVVPPFTSNSTSELPVWSSNPFARPSSSTSTSSAVGETDGKRKRSEFESEDGNEVVQQENLSVSGEAGSSHDGIPSLIDESEITGNSEGQHRGSGEDNRHARSDEDNVNGEGTHEGVEEDDQQGDGEVDVQQEDGDFQDEEEEDARPRPSKIRRLVQHLVVSATAAAMAYGFVAYEQHNTLVL